MQISKFITPEIIFGSGSISQVGESLCRLGAEKVFIVSDKGIAEQRWVQEAIRYVEQSGLDYHLWLGSTPNPKDYEIDRGLVEYKDSHCNAVLGIGGGSALDAAKAVALLSTNGGAIHDYEGVDKISRPLPPIVVLPTTAGSGSEVSQFSIITDSTRKLKMTIVSKSLIPDIAIVDPETLMSKDSRLTANTGMDALTHAIESYISLAATPLTEGYSLHAIKLISQYLRPSTASRYNKEAKEAMAMASLQAGIAFSNAILGAVHAMSHQLGGFLDTPHGEANAILLPYVMEYNAIACPHKYKQMAEAFGISTEGMSLSQAAHSAVQAVKEISRDLEIPESLSILGLQVDQIEALSRNAIQDACMITNPRDLTEKEVGILFKQALRGGSHG
ncbi:iron-containing alcohol dehydrogenase [Ammoniphilus sp. YIM 78166]|uniref:iron-containing alcohol dehydrogenase n=1 Tax=Ammoniphilus sp. YIM 78166 TaxID=1644106 RepID=UPI00106FCB90|nr:iron-containing alcohol dehydrogenase [Ammoniphilus sp. YIM 78166]